MNWGALALGVGDVVGVALTLAVCWLAAQMRELVRIIRSDNGKDNIND